MIDDTLLQEILAFRKERDWEQFHNLRTLATSIVLEAAELAEITQWTADADIQAVATEKRGMVEEEVADIAILLSYLVHDMKIDLCKAVRKKLAVNARKYPVAHAKGNAKKYDEFEQ